MTVNSTTGSPLLSAEQIDSVVVGPLIAESVALRTSTVVTGHAPSHRVPIVDDDPNSGWILEGAEIPISDPEFREVNITPGKIAGIVPLTSESLADAEFDSGAIIGEGIVRKLKKNLDAAYFANTTPNAPNGLESYAALVNSIDAGAAWVNFDPFAEALANAEDNGGSITHFVGSPSDVLALAKIKAATGSNSPLLNVTAGNVNGVSGVVERSIFGRELISSSAVPAGVVWAIDATRVHTYLRQDVEVKMDSSTYFISDRHVIRAICRAGWGVSTPAVLSRIALD